ncbi:ATP-grasp fold amidoligase family protein [Candidatus Cetobacterium colombiensis]|uniref:ATP-grasp fold amidoligase family protein n=1 Tax=Candidatus Cetobacterium colombiensis TaxID=3073100 RepID=A0ABU4WAA4_9FUSO|nr:ATP-grasp fold amidoligase family protein [Candidatus Cetobacterium colombiensis]MDX8335947.1 ATP-grasp fold amidoligase family protein [Candidatus Cetobacterium colombiensis]
MIKRIVCKLQNLYISKFFTEENIINYKYKKVYGVLPNLKNPVKFSEKIQCLKLGKFNELLHICSDKFLVKEYAKEKIGKEFIIPHYQVVNKWEEINFKTLPDKFVIKTNHDSGTVFIINNKNIEEKKLAIVKRKINKALKRDFGKISGEKFYSKIPRKIIVEKLLETPNGKVPPDFKFHMFKKLNNDFKIIIQVDLDRFENHKRGFFTENWKQLPYITSSHHKIIDFEYPKPKSIDKMIILAKKLSEDFDYVRVDFYDTGSEIYLGELTFAHGSGFEKFTLEEGDIEFGKYWECF